MPDDLTTDALMSNATYYSPSLPARMPRKAGTSKFESRNYFGLICFLLVFATTFIDINTAISKLTGADRGASLFILAVCVGTLVFFNFRIRSASLTLGFWYFALMAYYCIVGAFIRLIDFSSVTLFIATYHVRMNGVSVLIVMCAALGARHLMLAYSTEKALGFLFWLAMVPTLFVFLDYAFGDILFPQYNAVFSGVRASGLYTNPNNTGFATGYTAVIGFACLAQRNRMMIVFGILACGVACLLTFSRSSLVAFILLCGSQLIWSSVLQKTSTVVTGAVLTAVAIWFVLFGATSVFDLEDQQVDRLMSIPSLVKGTADAEQTGHRGIAAEYGLKKWAKSPIIGHGIGTSTNEDLGLGPHNQFIGNLVEGGIPLFILGLAFPAVVFWCGWRCPDPGTRAFVCGYFVIVMCQFMTDHSVYRNNQTVVMLGLCMGMLAAVNRREKGARQSRRPSPA